MTRQFITLNPSDETMTRLVMPMRVPS